MAKTMEDEDIPPIDRIAAVAKHGTDDELLELRADVRWLALWAGSVLDDLRDLARCATVTVGPERDADGYVVRSVSVTADVSPDQLAALASLVNRGA